MRRTSDGVFPLMKSCSWFFFMMRESPSSIMHTNLATMSSSDEDARCPVLKHEIHMSGTRYRRAAQNIETLTVFPHRRGVHTSTSYCTLASPCSSSTRERLRSKSAGP